MKMNLAVTACAIMLIIIIIQGAKLARANDQVDFLEDYAQNMDRLTASLHQDLDVTRGTIRDMTSLKRGNLKLIGDYDISHYAPIQKTGAAGTYLTPYKSVAIPADIKEDVNYGSTLILVYENQEIRIVTVEDFCPTDGRIDMVVNDEAEARALGVFRDVKVYQLN